MNDPEELTIYIVVIVDSGVTMAVQPCGTVEEADQFIANYFNSEDEMQKYGRTQRSLPGIMTWAFIDRNPQLNVTVTKGVLRLCNG